MKRPSYMHQFNISDNYKLNKEREIHLKKLDFIYKDRSPYGNSKSEKKERSMENPKLLPPKSAKIKNSEIQKENSSLLSRLLTISEKPSRSIPRIKRRNESQPLVNTNISAPLNKEAFRPKNEARGLFSILNNKYKKNVALNMALENKRIVETLKKVETTIPTLKSLEKSTLIQRIERFKKQDNNQVVNDLEKRIFKRRVRPLSEDRNSKSPKPATNSSNHRVNKSFHLKSEKAPKEDPRMNATTILYSSNKHSLGSSQGAREAPHSRSPGQKKAMTIKESLVATPPRATPKPRVQSANAGQKSKSKKQTAFLQAESMLKHLLNECQDILRDSSLIDDAKNIPENLPLIANDSMTHSKEFLNASEDDYKMTYDSLQESEERMLAAAKQDETVF